MGSNLKYEFICFSITCCFLPSPTSLGAHAMNSQFVSGQIKLPWGNKRDKECIVNISCYLTREISSFSRVEFILVCSKLCLLRGQERELQETLYFIDGIAEGWLGAEHGQFLVPPTTGRGWWRGGMQFQPGLFYGKHSGKLPMLMNLAGADSTAEDGTGCFREGEPSRALRGFLVRKTFYGLWTWAPIPNQR